jgi:hypothetical protein
MAASRSSCIGLLFVAAVWTWLPCLAMGQSAELTSPPNLTVQELLEGVIKNYQCYRDLPAFSVDYDLVYEYVAGAQRFAFRKASVGNVRKGERYRTSLNAVSIDSPKEIIQRVFTFDGKIGMATFDGANQIVINSKPDTRVFYYRYFDDFLSYPDGTYRAQLELGSLGKPVNDYWFPDALTQFGKEYRLGGIDLVDGVACHILDRKGLDRLWVDPAHGFVVRRRDYHFSIEGLPLRERTYLQDVGELAGAWLPRKIIREEYGQLDEEKALLNKLCARKTLIARAMLATADADSQFALQITSGAHVVDQIRGFDYIALKDGEDPFIKKSGEARPLLRKVWVLVAVALMLAAILVICFRRMKEGR